MHRPTLADVAKQAFVSVSTASTALSGGSGVSPETRERVERAARVLGYRPNAWARELRIEGPAIVGILTDPALHEGRTDSPQVFVRGLLHGLAESLGSHGAHPLILSGTAARPPVDAVVVLEVSDTAPAPGWLSHRVPQVVAGVPPLTRQAPVQLGHRVEQISEAVLTELAAPGDAVALVAPWGRMRSPASLHRFLPELVPRPWPSPPTPALRPGTGCS